MYYVTMTDEFMSGWGKAKGKQNKLVFVCETMEEAKIVEQNARNRSEMRWVNIRSTKPYYNKKYNYVQFKTKEDYPNWYVKGYFERR